MIATRRCLRSRRRGCHLHTKCLSYLRAFSLRQKSEIAAAAPVQGCATEAGMERVIFSQKISPRDIAASAMPPYPASRPRRTFPFPASAQSSAHSFPNAMPPPWGSFPGHKSLVPVFLYVPRRLSFPHRHSGGNGLSERFLCISYLFWILSHLQYLVKIFLLTF